MDGLPTIISSYLSYFNKFHASSLQNDGISNYHSDKGKLFLIKIKMEFPEHPWSYLRLGETSIANSDFLSALGIYEEMRFHQPHDHQGIQGVLIALVSLEKFDEANLFYTFFA